jgi:hypothetical protein
VRFAPVAWFPRSASRGLGVDPSIGPYRLLVNERPIAFFIFFVADHNRFADYGVSAV